MRLYSSLYSVIFLGVFISLFTDCKRLSEEEKKALKTDVKKALIMACEWILTRIQADGRLTTPSTDMWGNIAKEKTVDSSARKKPSQSTAKSYRLVMPGGFP